MHLAPACTLSLAVGMRLRENHPMGAPFPNWIANSAFEKALSCGGPRPRAPLDYDGLLVNPFQTSAAAVEGLMYLAPACTLWLAVGVGLLEFRTMAAEGAFGLIARRPGTYLAAAAMGFGVNALAYIVIQSSSSLTLKVPYNESQRSCP